MRWIYHLARAADVVFRGGRYAPPSLADEGFVHGSYVGALEESARLYFPDVPKDELVVLALDPRRLDAPVRVVDTPRGPMPHVHGAVVEDATRRLDLAGALAQGDAVRGTRVTFVAFEGMTLLDLVGPLDALARIASMGFDATTQCEVVGLATGGVGGQGRVVHDAHGMTVRVASFRPSLADADVLVLPGGPGARALAGNPEGVRWLATYPSNRLVASVCTGAFLIGATGRLRGLRATTHHAHLDALSAFGATPVRSRLVDEGQVVTAGGVTAGLDLGLHLVERLAGREAFEAIARQMEAKVSASPST